MNTKLLLLQLACLMALVLGGKSLKCKPPKIKFCNGCRDVEVLSTVALKKCKPGYKIVDGFCQTDINAKRSSCLPEEVKLPSGACRKKKRHLKRCAEISEELAKLVPVCSPGETPSDKCRKER
ncbi:Hypothetical predicted protein [Drosophila guanche]|uniref:Uncharacterized protein n=1 Tax=Drosophila guanche TaxID=7266 RepID=A0A3B0JXK7_DROGU|nr:Hypothetical predicted protein [Drosophila guanche]